MIPHEVPSTLHWASMLETQYFVSAATCLRSPQHRSRPALKGENDSFQRAVPSYARSHDKLSTGAATGGRPGMKGIKIYKFPIVFPETPDAHPGVSSGGRHEVKHACQVTRPRNSQASPMTDQLQGIVKEHLVKSLAPSTLSSYQHSWKLFHDFQSETQNYNITLPIKESIVVLFVAYLIHKNYAATSIKKDLSALSFSHKVLSLPFNSKSFLIGLFES